MEISRERKWLRVGGGGRGRIGVLVPSFVVFSVFFSFLMIQLYDIYDL